MNPHMRPDALIIDGVWFNDAAIIASRVAAAPEADRVSLRTALRFLYLDGGPLNLDREHLLAAQSHLDPAERLMVRLLYNQVRGPRRSTYGPSAALAARTSRYRCQECGHPDVWALNLDHVKWRVAGTPFACLCANCHAIKSRAKDWTGRKLEPIPAASADEAGAVIS
jgi:hypothetical protein